jgi:hypothetical protein
MLKKSFWLLTLPILLCGAIWWVQKARWNRIETDFRTAFTAESTEFTLRPSVELARHDLTGKYQKTLGQWQAKELELALNDVHLVHLMRSTPRMRFIHGPSYTVTYAIKGAGRYGITLAVDKDEADFNFASPQNRDKWRDL